MCPHKSGDYGTDSSGRKIKTSAKHARGFKGTSGKGNRNNNLGSHARAVKKIMKG